MMRSNSFWYSSGVISWRRCFSSSASICSAARFCSSSSSSSSVGAAPATSGSRYSRLDDRAVGALAAGLAADAVAVVVDERALGGELAALRVVAAHAHARRGERLPHRHAAVLVEIGVRVGQRPDEVLREHRVEPLRHRVGRGDDDAARAGEVLEERESWPPSC